MKALNIKTISDARKIIEERNIDYVKVGIFDIDGIFRGKYMQVSKFLAVLKKGFEGFEFCEVIFGLDSDDQLYNSNVTITGWHPGIAMHWFRLCRKAVESCP